MRPCTSQAVQASKHSPPQCARHAGVAYSLRWAVLAGGSPKKIVILQIMRYTVQGRGPSAGGRAGSPDTTITGGPLTARIWLSEMANTPGPGTT